MVGLVGTAAAIARHQARCEVGSQYCLRTSAMADLSLHREANHQSLMYQSLTAVSWIEG